MTPSSVSSSQLEACLAMAQCSEGLGVKVKEALDIIYSALEHYGEDKISLSFNGGKDCTVLLHLYATALDHWHRTRPSNNITRMVRSDTYPHNSPPIPALYISPPSPFPKLEAFISDSERRYNLSLLRQSGAPGMKDALRAYKNAFPNVEAILIGIRRTDPHGGKLSTSNPTDPDWPHFIRIHPILEWSYSDVWDFLRSLDVSYCSLYDIGYTSLGSTYNTFPNPALLVEEQDGIEDNTTTRRRFRPAYELEDEGLERAGRGPSIPIGVHPTVVDGSDQVSMAVRPRFPVPPSSELPTPAPERENPIEPRSESKVN